MLDVRRLRVLREVALRGSFSAAADSLSYTQSAISQQIAALERETGTTLVERGARGIRLTDAGEALVRHTDVILCRLAEAEAELEAIAGLRGGRLRLSTFPTAGATLMPIAIASFREQHPGVALELSVAEPPDAIAHLKAGEFDLSLSIGDPTTSDSEGIEHIHLLDDPMYVALPREHPLAGRRAIDLAELSDESWILGSTTTCPDSAILGRACYAAGFEPKVAFQSDDYSAIQGFVASGVGIALIPDLALSSVRDDIVIRTIKGRTPFREIEAIRLQGGYASPASLAMLDILRDVATEWNRRQRPLTVAAEA